LNFTAIYLQWRPERFSGINYTVEVKGSRQNNLTFVYRHPSPPGGVARPLNSQAVRKTRVLPAERLDTTNVNLFWGEPQALPVAVAHFAIVVITFHRQGTAGRNFRVFKTHSEINELSISGGFLRR